MRITVSNFSTFVEKKHILVELVSFGISQLATNEIILQMILKMMMMMMMSVIMMVMVSVIVIIHVIDNDNNSNDKYGNDNDYCNDDE